jgi:hypothetical protein
MADAPAGIEAALAEQARLLRGIMAQAVKTGKLHHAISARADLGKVQAELHRRESARRALDAPTEVERIQILRALAEGDGSWVAAAKYAAMEKAAALATETEADRATMTPEEWKQAVLEDAQQADDQDLEVYAHEWLTRVGLRLLVEDGEPRLVRAAG